jgi:hypothetical protein
MVPVNPANQALGENPSDLVPIQNPFGAIEAILREPRRVMFHLRQPGAGGLIVSMVFLGVLCGLVYGIVVGTFSGGTQLWAAPLKLIVGLLLTALICLPSLYIFTCLSGSKAKFAEVCGLVAGLLLLMTLLLLGFAPVSWLFSQSTESVALMGALHLVFWIVATFFGLRFLESGFSHFQARSSAGLNAWIIVFLLVALQMTTALRPFVGKSETLLPTEKKFFLSHWGDALKGRAATGEPSGK